MTQPNERDTDERPMLAMEVPAWTPELFDEYLERAIDLGLVQRVGDDGFMLRTELGLLMTDVLAAAAALEDTGWDQ